jgi:outer membrane receptor protein involved in Fe transport
MMSGEVETVQVYGRQKGTSVSRINPILTEKISSAGLKKLACCNIGESFENSATVTVGFSDAVSGTKQIRMLGLAGIYTQLLDESRPAMRGIASPYALAYIPGAWLESLQISKGTSSVAGGYEGLTGQINMEFRKPTSEDRLFVNAYLNSELRAELNLSSAFALSPTLSSIVLAHASSDFMQVDVNNDGFADQPSAQQLNAASRWLYTLANGAVLHAGLNALAEDRLGGQMGFDRKADRNDTAKYGSFITNRRINAYAKLGKAFGSNAQHSAALVADYAWHEQQSFFGQKVYNATQHSTYLNALLLLGLAEHHSASFGLNLRGDFYDEDYQFGSRAVGNKSWLLHQNEGVAGAFGEYTYQLHDKLTAIAGLRADYHNLHGFFATPRLHVKYNVTPSLVARASAGRALRSPNVFADNLWALANRRDIVAVERPQMEDAWNFGLSLTAYLHHNDEEFATIGVDVFRTQFVNQLIVDQEVSGNQILIYNLDGRSFANSYQVDMSVQPVERLEVFATFRYSDTRVQLREAGFAQKPLVDKFKGLLNVSYATRFNRWMFDVTAQLNGQMRLPGSSYVNYDYGVGNGYSPIYPMFLAQVTHKIRAVELYVGCENIGNYMQQHPVISVASPSSDDFNAGVVWGPLMGRKFYLGVRWKI